MKIFIRVIDFLYKKFVRGEPVFHQGKWIYPMPIEKCRFCSKHFAYYHPETICDSCFSEYERKILKYEDR
jgi:rRNA maturation endonuclease Nob1